MRYAAFVVLAACGDNHVVPPPNAPCAPIEALPSGAQLSPEIETRVDALLAQMTLTEKLGQMHGAALYDDGWIAHDNVRLGIRGFHMADGPRGVHIGVSTSFPVAIARGASFDRDLEREVGRAIGAETSAHDADVILAPTVNVLRHPAWGRAQETYGEDPYHIGVLASEFVLGAQEHVVATAKHFAVNSIEDTRFDLDVVIDERSLREVYLPQFETLARDAHVGAMMTGYHAVNGIETSEHAFLMRDILKREWGFSGFVMSDWFGAAGSISSLEAGLDMEMPGGVQLNEELAASVDSCALPIEYVDDAVRRILRQKLTNGFGAHPPVDPSVIDGPAHRELARRAARESIVLAKNQGGALPLGAAGTVVVVGALADVANLGDNISSDVMTSHAVTPLAGLRARFGDARVTHFGTDTLDQAQLAAVAAASATVVVVGLTAADEGEGIPTSAGDRETLALSAAQQRLISDVAAASARTIVVIEGGSAVLVEPWLGGVEAVLVAWYPGQEGGTALAEIIAGDVSPSGRMPMTWPVAEADLPVFDNRSLQVEYGLFHGYRWVDRNNTQPAFPFGHGLSYGEIEYRDMTLGAPADTLRVTVTVASIDRAGDEVVQLYIEPPVVAGVERAVRELRAFARATMTPGESQPVTLDIPIASLARYDVAQHAWVVDAGSYGVAVGPSSRDLPLRATFTVP